MSSPASSAKVQAFGAGRTYELVVVLGPPGFGKSSLANEYASSYRAKGGRVWILDPQNNWPGDPGQRWSGMKGVDDELRRLKTEGPGLLICDDADRYLRHPSDERLDLMCSFRHWQKDVVVISRRPQGIPKDAIQNANALALFSMREVYARRYVAGLLGEPKIMKEIPTERHQYLYVRQDTAELSRQVRKTKARAVVTASDKPR